MLIKTVNKCKQCRFYKKGYCSVTKKQVDGENDCCNKFVGV